MFNVIANNRPLPIIIDLDIGATAVFHRPVPAGAAIIDFVLAGHRVGHFVGTAFRRDTPRRRWKAAVKASAAIRSANDDAVNIMLSSGATEDQVAAWVGGYTEAMIPHAIAWNFGDA